MKSTLKTLAGAGFFAAALFLVLPHGAEAANTASNTTITNTATVNFEVGGVGQTAVTGSASFVVDNKVNVQVTKNADAPVVPGSTDRALSFVITNLGNTAQRYALTAIARATDNFDMNNVRIFRDNAPAGFDAGDTLYADAATFGDIASGATLTVLIVADTPATPTNGQTADYDLLATTVTAGGLVVTLQTAGANTAGVDVVFADAAGSAGAGTDDARDGKHSAVGTYTVSAASLTVSKTAAVYSDPFNNSGGNQKAIPGAVITYTVQVSNAAGGSQATNVAITDNLNAEITAGRIAFATQFNDGVDSCAAGEGIVVGGSCNTNAADIDNGSFAGNTVTASGLTINAGTSVTVKYQIVIQ